MAYICACMLLSHDVRISRIRGLMLINVRGLIIFVGTISRIRYKILSAGTISRILIITYVILF